MTPAGIDTTRRIGLPARLGITGDTHLGPRRAHLPERLVQGLATVDLIVHTGDVSSVAGWTLFEELGSVVGVLGNNDVEELSRHLPARVTLVAGETTILVTHGHLERGPSARAAVTRAWSGAADIVIFGHSHQPLREEVNGTTFLNPGSPTMKRRQTRFSYAILELDPNGGFEIEHVFFDER